MSSVSPVRVAIVDYGLGNLFSVKNACHHVGLRAAVTSSRQEISDADGVILPGVGAFGDAMESLKRLDLVDLLRDISLSGKPFLGICLGMQLLMAESYEFGRHPGLGIIEGAVVRLEERVESLDSVLGGSFNNLKVPQIGWNRVFKPIIEEALVGRTDPEMDPWAGTALAELDDGEFMYFVHSYYVKPEDASLVLSTTRYGSLEFCSTLKRGNTFGCQFHPERSGPMGLQLYQNFASMLIGRE